MATLTRATMHNKSKKFTNGFSCLLEPVAHANKGRVHAAVADQRTVMHCTGQPFMSQVKIQVVIVVEVGIDEYCEEGIESSTGLVGRKAAGGRFGDGYAIVVTDIFLRKILSAKLRVNGECCHSPAQMASYELPRDWLMS